MKTRAKIAVRSHRRRLLAATGGRIVRWCRGAGLDLLFPAVCAGCSAELESFSGPPLCVDCLGRLPLVGGATCKRCGTGVSEKAPREHCYHCAGAKLWFDETLALGVYEGLLRDWLLRMKKESGNSLTLAVAELLWQRQAERLVAWQPDVVVPVPMHWGRRLLRGTNSPTILAERLSQRMRVPLAANLLRRTRATEPQFNLPPSERLRNVRGAFAVKMGYHLEGAQVLVVDDILTTGATCSVIARVLKQRGASRVAVAIVGRAGRS